MNYGVIENGVCTNIIVADALFAAKIGAVELVEGFGIGDLYDGNWVKAEIVKSAEELRMEYEDLVFDYIRKKYTQTDENKLVREFLADVESEAEFFEYHNYVLECKTLARKEVYGEYDVDEDDVVEDDGVDNIVEDDISEDEIFEDVVVEELDV